MSIVIGSSQDWAKVDSDNWSKSSFDFVEASVTLSAILTWQIFPSGENMTIKSRLQFELLTRAQ